MPPSRPAITVAAVLDMLPEAIALTLLAGLPAFLNLGTERIFEEEKALLARAGALVALAGLLFRKEFPPQLLRHPVVAAGAALTLALTVATALGIAPREALTGAYFRAFGLSTWLALAVAFLVLCSSCRTAAGRERALTAVILGSLWPSAYALIQAAGADPVQWTGTIPGRASSTAGNPLLLAGYLVVVMPLTAARAWQTRSYALVVVLQATALMTTGSRGPLFALATAAVIAGAAYVWQPGRRRVVAAVVAAAAAAGVLLAFLPASRPAMLAERLDATSGSGRVRVLIWQGIGDLLPRSGLRLWIGHGPESLRRLFPPHYVAEIGRIEQTEAMPDRAHNELLDVAVAAGVVGVLGLLALYAAVIVSALRVEDRLLRAALTGAAVAHVLEIQLGIATVMSRLVFVAVAALLVGLRRPSADAPGGRDRGTLTTTAALAIAAAVAALSPAVSAAAFRAAPAAATLWLYAATALSALLVARTLAKRHASLHPAWPRVAAVAAAAVACVPMSIVPSRADGYARAGRELEQAGRWPDAVVAYEEAVRLQPRQEVYLAGLGRALMLDAQRLEGAPQQATLQRARGVLEAADRLNPHDPHAPRNLASVARIRARAAAPAAREPILVEADRLYGRATTLAPGVPALWAEWGNVDAERGRLPEALAKLAHATTLDPTYVDAWTLRGRILQAQRRHREALEAFDEALRHEPGNEAASRGRAAAAAALGGG